VFALLLSLKCKISDAADNGNKQYCKRKTSKKAEVLFVYHGVMFNRKSGVGRQLMSFHPKNGHRSESPFKFKDIDLIIIAKFFTY